MPSLTELELAREFADGSPADPRLRLTSLKFSSQRGPPAQPQHRPGRACHATRTARGLAPVWRRIPGTTGTARGLRWAAGIALLRSLGKRSALARSHLTRPMRNQLRTTSLLVCLDRRRKPAQNPRDFPGHSTATSATIWAPWRTTPSREGVIGVAVRRSSRACRAGSPERVVSMPMGSQGAVGAARGLAS